MSAAEVAPVIIRRFGGKKLLEIQKVPISLGIAFNRPNLLTFGYSLSE